MNISLYHTSDLLLNGYNIEFLGILSFTAILSSILVITCKNPIISILFLIALFFSISTYLMLLGVTFIGLSYLLVYVGAVSILFIFILMLINVRISELLTNTSNSLPLAFVIIVLFSYPIYQVLPNSLSFDLFINNLFSYYDNTSGLGTLTGLNYYLSDISLDSVFFVTSKSWDGNLAENTHITTIGNILYTNYAIWLIITSIILLLSMVGAIIITINHKDTAN